jgi:hypothetical protein
LCFPHGQRESFPGCRFQADGHASADVHRHADAYSGTEQQIVVPDAHADRHPYTNRGTDLHPYAHTYGYRHAVPATAHTYRYPHADSYAHGD